VSSSSEQQQRCIAAVQPASFCSYPQSAMSIELSQHVRNAALLGARPIEHMKQLELL
jgi:hypothetical protein